MNKYTYVAERIKESVSMPDAVQFYGFSINKSGFACCPFHSEKTPSFKVYEKSAHCFGCGWGGDVLDFVMRLFDLSFRGAVDKLNSDFQCGLDLYHRPTLRDKLAAQKQHARILAAKAAETERKRRYDSLWDEWIRLDKQRMIFAPKCQDDDLNPLFVEALQKISYVEYQIDTLL